MLYKRSTKSGAVWWCKFTIRKRQVRVSCGTASKALAEEFERRLRDQIWKEQELGEVIYTWEDAKERWLKEKGHKRSLERDIQAFAALESNLGSKAIGDIDGPLLSRIQVSLIDGRKPGTVNRIIACAASVLSAAVKWGWLAHSPKVAALYVDKSETRWITPNEFESLWRELPPHAKQITRFSVATGARAGNVFRLRWDDVDLTARVFRVSAAEFKGRRAVGFPLPPDALEVLEQQRGAHPVYVFTDHLGRAPVRSLKTCWAAACKRADLPGLRLHDLRHTFAAWHKLAGTPTEALKALGGWSDSRMVERYGHISPQDYAGFADNRRSNGGTQSGKKGGK